MPLYEYRCSNCKHKFELLRSISHSEQVTECPLCHGHASKIFSTFACFSKGSGGESTPVGGGGCTGCSSASCSTCH